jgi:hypothetical protein
VVGFPGGKRGFSLGPDGSVAQPASYSVDTGLRRWQHEADQSCPSTPKLRIRGTYVESPICLNGVALN